MYTYKDILIHSLTHIAPTHIVTSDEIEEQLRPFYEKCKLPFGRLELMTGIKQRHFWDLGTRPSSGAILAGKKAIENSGVPKSKIGAMVFTSVCRDFLEPATASVVHNGLGLDSKCMIFDISNACLGFLNGIVTMANMVALNQIEYGLVVSSECGRPLVEQTIKRVLQDSHMNRKTFKNSFASLTIGSGAVACLVSKSNIQNPGFLLKGVSVQAASEWVSLCQGDVAGNMAGQSSGFDGGEMPDMQTDSETMLHAGIALAKNNWASLMDGLGWQESDLQHAVTHQVGKAHQNLLFNELKISLDKDHPAYQEWGNTGSAALPIALSIAQEKPSMKHKDKIGLLGIGSGLNCLMLGIEVQKYV